MDKIHSIFGYAPYSKIGATNEENKGYIIHLYWAGLPPLLQVQHLIHRLMLYLTPPLYSLNALYLRLLEPSKMSPTTTHKIPEYSYKNLFQYIIITITYQTIIYVSVHILHYIQLYSWVRGYFNVFRVGGTLIYFP